MGEITFGEFTLSSVVAILLGVTFEAAPTFPSQYKKLVALFFGMVLGLFGIVVQGGAWTAANVILHVVAGIMYGVGAIGTYHTINKTDGGLRSASLEERPAALREEEKPTKGATA